MTVLASVLFFAVIFTVNLTVWGLIAIAYSLFAAITEAEAMAALVWMGSIGAVITTCMEFAAGWLPTV